MNHWWVTDDDLYVTYYFFIGNKVSWPTAGIENGSAGLVQEKLHDRITLIVKIQCYKLGHVNE